MHDTFAFDRLVGDSAWTRRTRRRILQAASYNYPVLITGPSGSGKELIARAIYTHDSRCRGPLIPFLCAHVPNSLRASQLFGHTEGAVSLTPNAALGCVGAARGGVLYLDEVAQLDADCQARLLSVLKAHRFAPVGSETAQSASLRIIASSSVDLHHEVRLGRFSFELLYRLNALTVTAAGLKERRDDIPTLVRHLIARTTLEHGLPLKQVTASALALLQAWDWPGNVDELEQVIEQAIVLSDEAILGPEAFPEIIEAMEDAARIDQTSDATDEEPVNVHESVPSFPLVADQWPTLAQVEADHIRATLEQVRHNLPAASRLLGLKPPQLQEKMTRYGIHPPLPRRHRDVQGV